MKNREANNTVKLKLRKTESPPYKYYYFWSDPVISDKDKYIPDLIHKVSPQDIWLCQMIVLNMNQVEQGLITQFYINNNLALHRSK